jgi:uncharacterized 2Fe-2S/4Fe-4S cluster protein (DUF4445 family)
MPSSHPVALSEDDFPDAAGASMADLLALAGTPVNARCGQRGLCRGCLVDLLDGAAVDFDGVIAGPGDGLRSCRLRLPPGGRVVVRVRDEARGGAAAKVADTFSINAPYGLDPAIAMVPGCDTGFAIDLGTTTVAVLLVDLTTGEVLSRAGALNAQVRFGDNVVTRIAAGGNAEIRKAMRRALVEETFLPLLDLACQRAGREPARLAGGTLAGNTTMLHILADEDPSPLGVAPFLPRFLENRMLVCGEVGLAMPGLAADAPLHLLPGLAAYLGADISAGIVSTGMQLDAEPSLLVDMGTNGEIVLSHDGRLLGCATAAGPAFEGAGLTSGTRARAGAIRGLSLSENPFAVATGVIGGGPVAQAPGLCGSAYVDFLATARTCGLLRGNGRFDDSLWAALPPERRFGDDGERAFVAAVGTSLRVSEIDIAHLLQAKAAIGAGIDILLAAAGLEASQIGKVYLAGGFGMHVSVPHAIDIGLLPGFGPDQVRVVGNSSLAGAFMALVDRAVFSEMAALRGRTEVLELNLQPGFEDSYIDHLRLP